MRTSPCLYGGNEKEHVESGREGRAYNVPGASKPGDTVFVVKCISGGCVYLVPGIFAGKAAAEALVKRRGNGVIVAVAIEG